MLDYTSWHQLLVLSVVFFYLQTCSCYYSVIFYLQFIMLLLRTFCLYARAPSPFLTHSLSCFLMTLDLHVQILDVLFHWSCVDELVRITRSQEFLSTYSGILAFCCFLWFLYIRLGFYFISYFMYYHVWTFTVSYTHLTLPTIYSV